MTEQVFANLIEPDQIRFIMTFMIPVGTVPTEEIPSYMEAVQSKLRDERLERAGFIMYFIPTRQVRVTVGERVEISIVKLETMQQVILFDPRAAVEVAHGLADLKQSFSSDT